MALSFAFGGSEGTTYDDLKRRQSIAQALWARGGQGTPKTAMEGLNSAAQSITGALLAKKLGRQIKGEQDKFGLLFNGALGGFGGQPMEAPMQPQSAMDRAYPVGQTGAPQSNTETVGGKAYDMGTPNDMGAFIRDGLVKRGLPEHVADGFVMNFKDESGLNPGINEQNPIVPGSRGGFGLAQWTGPRRKALEAFAAQRGVPVDDPNMQMDFLVQELQGPEARAAQRIMASQDAGSAAQAIVNDFLRPAEQHRAARAAKYGQSGGMSTPMLLSMASDPRASDAQRGVLQMLLQQQMQANDPLRQMQMQKMQAEIDGIGKMTPYQQAQVDMAQQRLNQPPEPTADQRNYQFYARQAQEAGQTPLSFNDWNLQSRKAGATTVNVGGDTGPQSQIGTIPQGYAAVPDPTSPAGYRMAAIPGGPEDSTKKDEQQANNRETSTSIITTAAQRARQAAEQRMVGGLAGSVAAWNPSSLNAEVYRQVEVMTANAKIENLNAMRAASPTGGALGSVTDKESAILADKSGALDPASPNFLRDLADYERTLLRIVHGNDAGDRIFEATRNQGGPDFSTMSKADIGQVDIGSLNDAQMDALEARMKELGL